MNLCHKWAGCIYRVEPAGFRRLDYSRGNAVRGKNKNRAFGNLVNFIDKYRAALFKTCDNVFVVNDFLANINRCTIVIKGLLNSDNSSVHSCAITPRGGQKHASGRGIVDFGHTPSLREITRPP
jgi:hypothetical protein